MSKENGLCNYCGKKANDPQRFVWEDVVVCSERCDKAMSWLLDGVSLEEVYQEFPEGKGDAVKA